MRYIFLTAIVLLMFLGSASAQAELPKPTEIEMYYYKDSGDCIEIAWRNVPRAWEYRYQVRITRNGPGKLEYKDRVPQEEQYRRWMDARDLPLYEEFDYGRRKSVNWCGLQKKQRIKVWLRVRDAEGNIGPKTKGKRFTTGR